MVVRNCEMSLISPWTNSDKHTDSQVIWAVTPTEFGCNFWNLNLYWSGNHDLLDVWTIWPPAGGFLSHGGTPKSSSIDDISRTKTIQLCDTSHGKATSGLVRSRLRAWHLITWRKRHEASRKWMVDFMGKVPSNGWFISWRIMGSPGL